MMKIIQKHLHRWKNFNPLPQGGSYYLNTSSMAAQAAIHAPDVFLRGLWRESLTRLKPKTQTPKSPPLSTVDLAKVEPPQIAQKKVQAIVY